MTLSKAPIVALSVVAMLAAPLPVSAQAPSDLRDLVGARAGSAEGEVQRRGYSFVRTQEGGTAKWSYWRRGDDCVQITTRDGRYAAIDRADRDHSHSHAVAFGGKVCDHRAHLGRVFLQKAHVVHGLINCVLQAVVLRRVVEKQALPEIIPDSDGGEQTHRRKPRNCQRNHNLKQRAPLAGVLLGPGRVVPAQQRTVEVSQRGHVLGVQDRGVQVTGTGARAIVLGYTTRAPEELGSSAFNWNTSNFNRPNPRDDGWA